MVPPTADSKGVNRYATGLDAGPSSFRQELPTIFCRCRDDPAGVCCCGMRNCAELQFRYWRVGAGRRAPIPWQASLLKCARRKAQNEPDDNRSETKHRPFSVARWYGSGVSSSSRWRWGSTSLPGSIGCSTTASRLDGAIGFPTLWPVATCAVTMSSGVGTWRTTEPLAKFSCEMTVVAKAIGIGDVAERSACARQRPAMHQVRDVIQAKRIDEFTAGRAARRTELLYVAQRDPCFGGDLGRAESGIGKAVLDDAADARNFRKRPPI